MRTHTHDRFFSLKKGQQGEGRGIQKAAPRRPQACECVVIAPPPFSCFVPRNTPPHASPYNPVGGTMWPGVRSYESMPAPLKAGPVIVVVIIGGIVTVVTESAIRPSIARDFVLHGCACTPFAKQKPRAILSLFVSTVFEKYRTLIVYLILQSIFPHTRFKYYLYWKNISWWNQILLIYYSEIQELLLRVYLKK